MKPKDLLDAIKKKDENISYSSIMRELNRHHPDAIVPFMKNFKSLFIKAKEEDNESNVEEILMQALQQLKTSSVFGIMMMKKAAVRTTDAISTGTNMAKIIDFMLESVSNEDKANYKKILKNKFFTISSADISNKKMPETAVLGQIITFVKTILAGSDERYISSVLDSLRKHL